MSRRSRGFTIIEVMVVISIVAIVLAMVVPNFATMMQNSRLGSAAKSYLVGIQTARAEAIRRNLPVEFVTTDTTLTGDFANSAVAANGGKGWVVRAPDVTASAAGTYVPVEAKAALEGSGQSATATVRMSGAVTAPTAGAFSGVLAFNGLGGTLNGETIVFDIDNPTGGACAAASGPMRCQRIQVRPGGQVTLCDPAAAAGDSRACPF